jgi:hypothetical protein
MKMYEELDDKKVQAMFREIGICAHLIGSGLTTIRKANFVEHWNYGSSFFQLTIGIERLGKLILIRKFQRINNGRFPDNNYIRKFSHNISELIDEIIKDSIPKFIGKNAIVDSIIKFFSDFARSVRYFNLDSITKEVSKDHDPMLQWKLIQDKIVELHYKKREFSSTDNLLINSIEENAIFLHNDLDGKAINSASDYFNKCKTVDVVQKYSVFYIYNLIKDIIRVIHEEECLFYTMPVMSEFFPLFYEKSLTKQKILNRKKWNI